MAARDIAYLLATALQRKLKDGHIIVRIEYLTSERIVVEYMYRVGDKTAHTAYSEGFFETPTTEFLSWLGNRIRTELQQRLLWQQPKKYDGDTNDHRLDAARYTNPPNARRTHKTRTPRAAKVSIESIP